MPGKEAELKEKIDEDELTPIEQVRLTVTDTDDPSLPVWTFSMWSLGLLSCGLLSFLNQFFSYRTESLIITQITVQVATLPIGHFMASVLRHSKFRAVQSTEYTLISFPPPYHQYNSRLATTGLKPSTHSSSRA